MGQAGTPWEWHIERCSMQWAWAPRAPWRFHVLSHPLPGQGGTDAEKHRDLLAAENERLRQEMKACEGELRELQRQQQAPCRDCPHLQVRRRWWQWWWQGDGQLWVTRPWLSCPLPGERRSAGAAVPAAAGSGGDAGQAGGAGPGGAAEDESLG